MSRTNVAERVKTKLPFDFIFYDFEVFAHDWMIVVYIESEHREFMIHNDTEKLRGFFHKHQENCIWVGWNSAHYDVYIMKAILLGINPKKVNDLIIRDNIAGWQIDERFKAIQFMNYDVMMNCGKVGLKTVEGNIGSDIRETEVPFDIERPLTAEEVASTEFYCRHDVEQTREAFLIMAGEFDSDLSVIDAFGLERKQYIGRTRQQLVGVVMEAKPMPDQHDEFRIHLPETLVLHSERYKEAAEWFMGDSCHPKLNPNTGKYVNPCKVVKAGGVSNTIALGGMHGAKEHYHLRKKGCIWDFDVKSDYPSLMIQYNLQARSVTNRDKFKRIYADRLRYKKAGDPRAGSYKIVINSAYGAMGMEGSPLYDPRNRLMVCVYGQLFLLDLIERLEEANIKGFEMIQTNTDGIMFQVADDDAGRKAQLVAEEWQERTRLSLDYDCYDEIWQKDVNHYYLIRTVEKDGKEVLEERAKGVPMADNYPRSNSLGAVGKAMRAYFLYHTPVMETLEKDDVLMDFQMISSPRAPCDIWAYRDKDGITLLNNKVNRLFASKLMNDGEHVLGKRADIVYGLNKQPTLSKIYKASGMPAHTFAVLDNVKNIGRHVYDDRIDLTWYAVKAIDLIKAYGAEIDDVKPERTVVCNLGDFM